MILPLPDVYRGYAVQQTQMGGYGDRTTTIELLDVTTQRVEKVTLRDQVIRDMKGKQELTDYLTMNMDMACAKLDQAKGQFLPTPGTAVTYSTDTGTTTTTDAADWFVYDENIPEGHAYFIKQDGNLTISNPRTMGKIVGAVKKLPDVSKAKPMKPKERTKTLGEFLADG